MKSSNSAVRWAAVWRSRPYMRPAKLSNSDPVRRPNNAIPSGTTPICRFTSTGCVVRSSPRISIRPALGARRPVSILMVVDFPAPLGPRKPKNCPGATRRSMPSTAINSPKRRVRPWVEIVGAASMKNLNLAQARISPANSLAEAGGAEDLAIAQIKNALALRPGVLRQNCNVLEQVPEELVVDVVVILHLGRLHEGSQQTRTAVRRCLLQISIAAFYVFTQQICRPLCFAEVFESRVDVVRQVALGLPEVLDLRGIAVDAALEDRQHHQIWIGIRRHRTNFHTHALLVADRNADHRSTIHGRGFDLVGRLEVWIQTAIGIHAGVQQQADVIAMSKDAIEECPALLAELFFALPVPEQVLAVLADRDIRMHAAAVHANHGLRKERSGQAHVGRDLAADKFVKLYLVGGSHDFAVSVIDFELRRRNFGMVFLVLEAHRALHFRCRIDESAQSIAGKRVIVSARIYVFELSHFVIVALRVGPLEQ